MAKLVINDVAVKAEVGEDVLSVARRHRAHIGFFCDGNGLCTTCECQVTKGMENLSEPNDVERNWLPRRRLAKGYRLGCQTVVVKDGDIALLTRAEDFRRMWDAVLNPPPGTDGGDNLAHLTGKFLELNVDHLSNFPFNLANTVVRLGLVRTLLPVRDNTRWLRDIGRVIDERTGDTFSDGSVTVKTNPSVKSSEV